LNKSDICIIIYVHVSARQFDKFFLVNCRQYIVDNKATTRNSSGDEIANMNFLYDDIVHALKIQ